MMMQQGDEAHVVEGLECGSNDYIVKPFGRKEILARVAAHIAFRNAVFAAGETAGGGGSGGDHSGSLSVGSSLPALLAHHLQQGQGRYSLPPSLRYQLESSGRQVGLQMFEQLTMVVVDVSNLGSLIEELSASDLVSALSRLFVDLDELLDKHKCYLVDSCHEGKLVVVAGLAGSVGRQQVSDAVSFAIGALSSASHIKIYSKGGLDAKPTATSVMLSIGIHTSATQV